jgi:hypothetical protein
VRHSQLPSGPQTLGNPPVQYTARDPVHMISFYIHLGFPSRCTRTQPETFIAVGSRLVLLCIRSMASGSDQLQWSGSLSLCTSLLFDSSPVCQWESFFRCTVYARKYIWCFHDSAPPLLVLSMGIIALPEEHQLFLLPTVPSRQKT